MHFIVLFRCKTSKPSSACSMLHAAYVSTLCMHNVYALGPNLEIRISWRFPARLLLCCSTPVLSQASHILEEIMVAFPLAKP